MMMLQPNDRVVVVGAGLAGWRFCEAVRREGYAGSLTLVGDEVHPPYDRPPLSKQVLSGKWTSDQTTLATSERVRELNVELRLGHGATALDLESLQVTLEGGELLRGTHVVIATGTRARRLPFSADARLSTLRSRDDVDQISQQLATLSPQAPVAIIGGGFIGAEAATALKARGLQPVVFEAAERPLRQVLGEEVSSWLAGLAAAAGVELRTQQKIRDVVETSARDFELVFEDATTFRADMVLVGAGAVPNTEWLADSGLEIDNGVLVDEHLRATERVAALGDVARFLWPSVTGTERVRIEHWQVANDHAAALAKFWVTGESSTALMVPYFWSDQYGKKIQVLGHPRPTDEVRMVSGSLAEEKWTTLYYRDNRVTGVVTLSQPRSLMLSRPLLEAPVSLDDALELAPWSR